MNTDQLLSWCHIYILLLFSALASSFIRTGLIGFILFVIHLSTVFFFFLANQTFISPLSDRLRSHAAPGGFVQECTPGTAGS